MINGENFNNPTLPIMITSANKNFIPKPIEKDKRIATVDYSTSKKVLLINDDQDSIYLIAGQLINYGVEVDTAMNVIDALEKLMTKKYELVLIDIVLGKNQSSKDVIDYIQHHNFPKSITQRLFQFQRSWIKNIKKLCCIKLRFLMLLEEKLIMKKMY